MNRHRGLGDLTRLSQKRVNISTGSVKLRKWGHLPGPHDEVTLNLFQTREKAFRVLVILPVHKAKHEVKVPEATVVSLPLPIRRLLLTIFSQNYLEIVSPSSLCHISPLAMC